jgi:hypothetical protein
VIIGAGTIILAVLPIPRWVGAPDPGPDFAIHVQAWALGALVVATGSILVGRAATRFELRPFGWFLRNPGVVVWSLTVALVVGSCFVMWWAFAGNPHSVDEMAQLFHARVFLSGQLTAPPPEPPEAFLFLHTWITPAGWVSQFPPMQAVLLAMGMAVGVEWLVNPLLGGIALILVYLLARGLYGERTAVLCALLWAASAWVLTMSATYMNHAAAAVFALGAWTAALAGRRESAWHFLLSGALLGALLATRPLDAVAATLPIAVWVLMRRPRGLVWIGLGGLPMVLLLAYFNWRVFGHPLEFGYGALYGQAQRMGFHVDVFGNTFTPTVAVGNLAAAVRRLHIYLFEWPIPAMLPLAVWAILARHRHPSDLPVAIGIVSVPALYFFYWHSGFYPGPRFYYLIAPLLVIGTARAYMCALHGLRRRSFGAVRWDAALVAAGIIVVVWGSVSQVPTRLQAYRTQFLRVLKQHPERDLANAGVDRAVVLVPESWGARIIVDLWTLGVRPGLAERAYRRLDACELHQFANHAREARLDPAQAEERIIELTASAAAPAAPVKNWPDPTLRLRSPDRLSPECQTALRRDLQGFALYGALAWRNPVGLDHGIVFARDRFEKNDELLARYPGWEVWRYAPPPGEHDAPPVLTRVRQADDESDGA